MIQFDASIQRGSFNLEAHLNTEASITGIFGPSGSGKTTLLHCLAGLFRPAHGRLQINESTLFSSDEGINLRPEQRRIALVFQDNRLFPHCSVQDNVMFGYRRLSPSERAIKPNEVMDIFNLHGLLTRSITRLSGGEMKRVAMARALLTSPRLLMLDEPLAGLDQELRHQVLAYLLQLARKEGLRMLYVSHTLSDFLALSDAAAVIRNGTVEMLDNPEAIIDTLSSAITTDSLESIHQGHVIEESTRHGYTAIDLQRLTVNVSMHEQPVPGSEVVVLIQAKDVLLATGPEPTTSARNCWPGRIVSLKSAGNEVIARVDVGIMLYAELTPEAVSALDLEVGKEVHVLIKARALKSVRVG